jgi:hypothetical protein
VQRREPATAALAGALQRLVCMLVFRSLALGLLGACCLLFASHPLVELHVVHERPVLAPMAATVSAPTPATIVDIAPGLAPAQIASLIQLAPDEHVASVDDTPVHGDLDAGALLASHELLGGHYVDLGVANASGARRVLVLLH